MRIPFLYSIIYQTTKVKHKILETSKILNYLLHDYLNSDITKKFQSK